MVTFYVRIRIKTWSCYVFQLSSGNCPFAKIATLYNYDELHPELNISVFSIFHQPLVKRHLFENVTYYIFFLCLPSVSVFSVICNGVLYSWFVINFTNLDSCWFLLDMLFYVACMNVDVVFSCYRKYAKIFCGIVSSLFCLYLCAPLQICLIHVAFRLQKNWVYVIPLLTYVYVIYLPLLVTSDTQFVVKGDQFFSKLVTFSICNIFQLQAHFNLDL
jgi:hypothetical protein